MSEGEGARALPPGWAWTKLGDLVVSMRNGISIKPTDGSGIPILRISSVRPLSLDAFDVRYLPRGADTSGYELRAGDLLYTRYNGNADLVGACAQVDHDIREGTVYPDKLIRVRVDVAVAEASYIAAASSTGVTREHIRASSKSAAGQVGISGGDLRCSPIPIAPLAEQRRIVAKLDELLAGSRRSREALDAVPALLDQYRRSVLAAAFRGELTAEWRGTHLTTSTGQDLLATVLRPPSARSSRIDTKPWDPELEQGRWAAAELPNTWAWAQFSDLFADATSSDRKLPQSDYSPAGALPVVDQGAVCPGGYSDRAELGFAGELPVIVFGDHTRRVHFVETAFIQGADGTKVLSPRSPVEPRFLWCVLQAIELPDKGYSRHFKFLRASRFPLPPVTEQQEIVRRLDDAFLRIDAVRDHVAAQRAQLDALDRAILDKAFRGELVPQDPNDEPASVMLERLRAERAAVGTEKKPKTRRHARKEAP